MTDLPVCRLCQCGPTKHTDCRGLVFCSDADCPCAATVFTEEQWRTLMYVPEKKPRDLYATSFDTGRTFGYNEAVDKMLSGGTNG